jgi:GTP cyclohydrolase II
MSAPEPQKGSSLDDPSLSPHESRAVLRAVDALRRGWPVRVRLRDGSALLVLATETAQREELDRWPGLCLILTARRGAALHLPLHDERALAVAVSPEDDLAILASLADATQDLARPLRGPWRTIPVPKGAAAALRLAKAARLLPSVFSVPAGNGFADDAIEVESAAIERFESAEAASLRIVVEARLPTALAENGRLIAFRAEDGDGEHLAFIIGDPKPHEPVLARLHSECFTGDLLGSLRCDCGEQLRGAIARMREEGGILLYLRQEGRGIGLLNKLRAYRVQDEGFDTLDANLRLGFEADERLFAPAARMLTLLGYRRVRLLTNNPDKVAGLAAEGIEVTERVPHAFPAHAHNEEYLRTKAKRSGHYLDIKPKAEEE